MRIGFGYDVHRLVSDRKLILGGVKIKSDLGLLGHSDADVLTHAIIDSLYGALSLGDIGSNFPDTSSEYKDINSMILLERCFGKVKSKGYVLGNIDCTIVAQYPKLSGYILEIRESLAKMLEVSVDDVSVKATTEEGMGFTGAKEGMSAYAVCLLLKSTI